MIRSMTGYGEASAQIDGVHYFVEVRSLNNKYFKASIRLPEDLQGLEAELESELRKRINRGTVTLRASCTDTSESAASEINHRALEHYIRQVRKTESVKNGELSVDVGTLLALPGVLQAPANEESRLHHARDAFVKLLDDACNRLIKMRDREGVLLAEDLEQQRSAIAERLAEISGRAPDVVREYENRLRSRLETMLKDAGISVEPVDLVREIAVYAEKTDIAEELSRLAGHIEQFGELVEGEAERPVGRTLDFLSQEMLREANTIASKSPDALISRRIVEIKGAIDRIKEQVQNVE